MIACDNSPTDWDTLLFSKATRAGPKRRVIILSSEYGTCIKWQRPATDGPEWCPWKENNWLHVLSPCGSLPGRRRQTDHKRKKYQGSHYPFEHWVGFRTTYRKIRYKRRHQQIQEKKSGKKERKKITTTTRKPSTLLAAIGINRKCWERKKKSTQAAAHKNLITQKASDRQKTRGRVKNISTIQKGRKKEENKKEEKKQRKRGKREEVRKNIGKFSIQKHICVLPSDRPADLTARAAKQVKGFSPIWRRSAYGPLRIISSGFQGNPGQWAAERQW